MKLKTKQILAGFGMGVTAVAGLSCVGLGLYAILTMKRPYINQFVDLYKEEFDPIVSPVDNDFIKQEIGHEPDETDVVNFYFDKVNKTPEILVEDILEHVNVTYVHVDGSDTKFYYYKVRISDPTLIANDKKYFISFLYNESYKVIENNDVIGELDWSGSYTNFPISFDQTNGIWKISIKPTLENGTATIKINKNSSSYDGKVGTYEIEHGTISDIDTYFQTFSFSSRYLENVNVDPSK